MTPVNATLKVFKLVLKLIKAKFNIFGIKRKSTFHKIEVKIVNMPLQMLNFIQLTAQATLVC